MFDLYQPKTEATDNINMFRFQLKIAADLLSNKFTTGVKGELSTREAQLAYDRIQEGLMFATRAYCQADSVGVETSHRPSTMAETYDEQAKEL